MSLSQLKIVKNRMNLNNITMIENFVERNKTQVIKDQVPNLTREQKKLKKIQTSESVSVFAMLKQLANAQR